MRRGWLGRAVDLKNFCNHFRLHSLLAKGARIRMPPWVNLKVNKKGFGKSLPKQLENFSFCIDELSKCECHCLEGNA